MPRGGSKKGEHRGNAKARTDMATPNQIMRKAVQPKKPNEPGKGAGRPPGRENIATTEQHIQLAQIVHGRKSAYDLSPKEVMLNNMHFFQNNAYTAAAMNAFAVETMPAGEQKTQTIRALEMEEERCRRIASDEAYKVAPYMHSRRVALNAGDDRTEDDIVSALLDEIDKRNREHPMVIEHIPTKRTV